MKKCYYINEGFDFSQAQIESTEADDILGSTPMIIRLYNDNQCSPVDAVSALYKLPIFKKFKKHKILANTYSFSYNPQVYNPDTKLLICTSARYPNFVSRHLCGITKQEKEILERNAYHITYYDYQRPYDTQQNLDKFLNELKEHKIYDFIVELCKDIFRADITKLGEVIGCNLYVFPDNGIVFINFLSVYSQQYNQKDDKRYFDTAISGIFYTGNVRYDITTEKLNDSAENKTNQEYAKIAEYLLKYMTISPYKSGISLLKNEKTKEVDTIMSDDGVIVLSPLTGNNIIEGQYRYNPYFDYSNLISGVKGKNGGSLYEFDSKIYSLNAYIHRHDVCAYNLIYSWNFKKINDDLIVGTQNEGNYNKEKFPPIFNIYVTTNLDYVEKLFGKKTRELISTKGNILLDIRPFGQSKVLSDVLHYSFLTLTDAGMNIFNQIITKKLKVSDLREANRNRNGWDHLIKD